MLGRRQGEAEPPGVMVDDLQRGQAVGWRPGQSGHQTSEPPPLARAPKSPRGVTPMSRADRV